jgi:hypothetical protein
MIRNATNTTEHTMSYDQAMTEYLRSNGHDVEWVSDGFVVDGWYVSRRTWDGTFESHMCI